MKNRTALLVLFRLQYVAAVPGRCRSLAPSRATSLVTTTPTDARFLVAMDTCHVQACFLGASSCLCSTT